MSASLIIGIIVVLAVVALLMISVYKGLDPFFGCCIAACLVCLGCQLPIYSSMTSTFWEGAFTVIKSMGFCLILSVLLGQVYLRSGAIESIGQAFRKALIRETDSPLKSKLKTVYLFLAICLIMGACGMNVYVATFCLIPMGMSLFKAADLPRKPVPAILAGCMAMAGCLPGTPLYTNVLASAFYGTHSTSNLIPGIVGVLVMLILNILWLLSFCKKSIKNDLHFEDTSSFFTSDGAASMPLPPGPGGPPAPGAVAPERKKPHWILALIPLIVNVVLYGFVGWQVEPTLLLSIVLGLIFFSPYILRTEQKKWSVAPLLSLLGAAAAAAFPVVMTMGAQMGYAQIVSSTDVYNLLIGWLQNLPLPGYITFALFASLSGFLAGDAVAGLIFSSQAFLPIADKIGITPDAMHRITLFAISILDTLPICAGVIAMLKASNMTHKQGYSSIFRTTVVYPFIGMIVCILMNVIFPNII